MGLFGSGKSAKIKSIKHIATYMYPINDNSERVRFGRLGFKVNMLDYLKKKPNQNLLITGTTGQGKSKLMRLMLEMMPNPKTIFSYKEGDEYLQIEGNLIPAEKSLPDAFADPEAFTSAFAVTFNITSEGIQASTAMSIVASIAKESSSWDDFVGRARKHAEKARDANVRAATNYLLQKIKSLVYISEEAQLDLDKTNILDMSYLNEEAKTFYSELFLRQLYRKIRERPDNAPKVIVCVDEAHRLTRNIEGRHQSIVNEMSREIRAFGMLWTATQNLTDIPDPLRNQFATQLAFSTTSEADLRALSQISRDLSVCISGLRNHEFIDAKTEKVHKAIAIYRADINGLGMRKIEPREKPHDKARHSPPSSLQLLKPPEDRPTPTLHAAMLTIYENPNAKLSELAKYIKAKGWVTSDPTIYGSKDRKGVFESLVSLGFATKEYKLTDKALEWIDSSRIVEKAKNSGSDLHKQLMRRTIDKLREDNTLTIVPEGKDVPDLVAYPMSKGDKKYLWDDKNRRACEIQTSARRENILTNRERDIGLGLPITWIAYDERILSEIKKITEDKDKYVVIKV